MLFPEISVADVRPKIRNSRQYIVSLFVERLNEKRDSFYRALKPSFVAFKMSHMRVDELYTFYDACLKKDNFSKYWWWSLNTKKHDFKGQG